MATLIQLLLNKKRFMFFLSVRVHLYLNISASKILRMLMHLALNQPCCYNKLVGLNLDRASTSMGKHNDLNILVRDEAPRAEVVHCFNHWLELSIKYAFIESTFYSNINEMLSKLHWFYIKKSKKVNSTKRIKRAFRKIDTKTHKS